MTATIENLQGKCIILGVSGGIAAYKAASLASALHKTGADVHVIMTENATRFIAPLTFETLTGNRCITDMFARDFPHEVAHISLSKAADLILVAPATADILAKMAAGIADDMLTTVVLAAECRKMVAPSMNTAMLANLVTRDNLRKLEEYGFTVIPPDSGMLACGDTGSGKLPEPSVLLQYVYRELAREKSLSGVRVTVTAGPTREPLDPVRFLSNRSTGKMGYAIAREAMLRGATVTLISGPVSLDPVPFTAMRYTTDAADMFSAVRDALPETDILIMAAAVADFRPASVSDEKIKKGGVLAKGGAPAQDGVSATLPLESTEDILSWVSGHRHPGLFVCGFSMETEHLLDNSRRKLAEKHLDMIVANNLKTPGAGFATDTNVVTILAADGTATELPLMTKEAVASDLLDAICVRRREAETAL